MIADIVDLDAFIAIRIFSRDVDNELLILIELHLACVRSDGEGSDDVATKVVRDRIAMSPKLIFMFCSSFFVLLVSLFGQRSTSSSQKGGGVTLGIIWPKGR